MTVNDELVTGDEQPDEEDERTVTAWHEAGHAVAATAQGFLLRDVRIGLGDVDRHSGDVTTGMTRWWGLRGSLDTPAARAYIAAAGPYSEAALFVPQPFAPATYSGMSELLDEAWELGGLTDADVVARYGPSDGENARWALCFDAWMPLVDEVALLLLDEGAVSPDVLMEAAVMMVEETPALQLLGWSVG